jgi:SAM-dependent methyltransferase
MNKCRICNSEKNEELIDLGLCPLAGAFLSTKKSKSEIFSLKLTFCKNCKSAQVIEPVLPEKLFGNYHYASSQVEDLLLHFKNYYKSLRKFLNNNEYPSLLDIGCNDGVLIKNFVNDKNIKVVGVDPSFEPYEVNNVKTIKKYFDSDTAEYLNLNYGKFDIINASNVFAHIIDLNLIFKLMVNLLKDNGQIKIEVHSILELLKSNQYDTIYHEHIYYHSINSLNSFAVRNNIYLTNIEKIETHGGSLRATFCKQKPKIQVSNDLKIILNKENNYILKYKSLFRDKTNAHIMEMTNLVKVLINSQLKIGAYGASGRAVMFLNQIFKTNKNELKIIIDDSDARIGLKLPLLKTDIANIKWLDEYKLDIIIISAWNYSETIINKLKKVKYKGLIIIPFPNIKVINMLDDSNNKISV